MVGETPCRQDEELLEPCRPRPPSPTTDAVGARCEVSAVVDLGSASAAGNVSIDLGSASAAGGIDFNSAAADSRIDITAGGVAANVGNVSAPCGVGSGSKPDSVGGSTEELSLEEARILGEWR